MISIRLVRNVLPVILLFLSQIMYGQSCSTCDPANPDFILYLDPLITGTNGSGNTTAAQYDVYLMNNTASNLNLTTIEFSFAINASLVPSLMNMSSDASYFLNSLVFDPIGGNFVTIYDNYFNPISVAANGVTYTGEYEYDHVAVGPANPPQVILPGLPTQIMTVYMNFDGTQAFLDDSSPFNLADPFYICNEGFFMPFPGECVFPEPNVNNQFGFVDDVGDPVLINCYGVACGNPFNFLPVEFSDFEGQTMDNNNELDWTTASERDAQWHIIQRSSDPANVSFTEIGRISASGDSESEKKYHFVDADPIRIAYYRIKTTAYDGAVSYSEIINLERKGSFEILTVKPNPASDFTQIEIGLDQESDIRITILDGLGRIVYSKSYHSDSNFLEKTLSLEGLPKGLYLIKVDNGREARVKKILRG